MNLVAEDFAFLIRTLNSFVVHVGALPMMMLSCVVERKKSSVEQKKKCRCTKRFCVLWKIVREEWIFENKQDKHGLFERDACLIAIFLLRSSKIFGKSEDDSTSDKLDNRIVYFTWSNRQPIIKRTACEGINGNGTCIIVGCGCSKCLLVLVAQRWKCPLLVIICWRQTILF
jgi:hypothetical protein